MNESREQRSMFSVPAVSSLWAALAGFGLPTALPFAIHGWEPGSVGMVAVLSGVVGLIQARRKLIRRKDSYYAAGGVILGCVLIVMCGYGFFGPYGHSPRSACSNNLKQIGMAVEVYRDNHSGKFPPVGSWNSAVIKYSDHKSILYCPEADKSMPSYAMNSRLSGVTIDDVADPSATVLVFESIPGKDLFGGPGLLPSPARHGRSGDRSYVVLFCDGHVKSLNNEEIGGLNWDPKKKGKPALPRS